MEAFLSGIMDNDNIANEDRDDEYYMFAGEGTFIFVRSFISLKEVDITL